MNFGRIFLFISMGINICTALGYACAHDWRRSIYFLAAFVLNACIAF